MDSTIHNNSIFINVTKKNNTNKNINMLTKIFQELLLLIGEDPNRSGLKNTAVRAANSWLFLTSGYTVKPKDIINNALFDCSND